MWSGGEASSGFGIRLRLGRATRLHPSCFSPCREISAESERESQQLQNYWSEVRYLVRCIYRQTGTPLADDHDQPLDRDQESMKELVDRYADGLGVYLQPHGVVLC